MSSPTDTENRSDLEQPKTEKGTMAEYYQLQRYLYLVMLVLTGTIFVGVWLAYSGQTALNYLLGAIAGLLYFRRLARDIEGLNTGGGFKFGGSRLGIFIAVMIIATQIKSLSLLPVFLGFLTYKAAIIVYVLQTALFRKSE